MPNPLEVIPAATPADRDGPGPVSPERRYPRLRRWLSRPGLDRWFVVLSFVLMQFSLDTGLSADDYIHMMIARGSTEIAGFVREPLDMFRFTSGDATRQLMREGVVSWWDDPSVKLAFFRPLSALTHFIDYRLWPDQPWLMHLHSSLWALLLFWGILAVYRKLLEPRWVCTLAVALYVLDDARAWFVSWIAARNAVVATAVSIWVLYHHHRNRSEGVASARWVAWFLFALSLLAGEGAVSICAYLFAHAVFIDRQDLRSRLLSLVPYAAITAVYRAFHGLLGYGVAGSGLYFDPVREPLGFLGAVLERGPILLFSQVGGTWSDGYTGLYPYPFIENLVWGLAALGLCVLFFVLWPVWRRDALFRFGTSGGLLSLLPASAVFSADRMLSWVAIGASIALARAVAVYADDPQVMRANRLRGLLAPPVFFLFLLSHLVLDPPLLASRARGNQAMRQIIDRAQAGVPSDPSIEERFVVYLNPAAMPLAGYIPIERAAQGIPRPKQQYWLAAGVEPVTVERLDEHTLRVAPEGGFVNDEQSWLLRSPHKSFTRGQVIELEGLRIEVEKLMPDGRPAVILARFERSLDDPIFLWLKWGKSGFERFEMPAIGKTVKLPAADFVRVVFGDNLAFLID